VAERGLAQWAATDRRRWLALKDPTRVRREANDEREGHYSNCFKVGYTAFEFLLDFGQAYESATPALYHTRLITGPAYAKALASMLDESLAEYERAHGTIPEIATHD
jgi:hypothetical protein